MKNWTSQSVGSCFQQNIFYYLIKFFGHIPAYALLYVVILWYTATPSIRKRASYYLRKRFPDYESSALRAFLHTYRLYLNFGKVLLDRAIMGITGKSETDYNGNDFENLAQICLEEKGIIITTAHTGLGETNMALVNFLEKKVHIVLYFDEKDTDKHYYEYENGNVPCRIINSNSYLGGALEILAALDEHGAICMMGDRPVGGDSVPTEFLGHQAYFPISPYKYAAAMDAKVVICFSVRTGVCKSHIYIADIIEIDKSLKCNSGELAVYSRRFAKLLEDFTDNYPYQFFNFYDMWSCGE